METLNKKQSIKAVVILILVGGLLRLALTYFQYAGDVRNHLAWADSFLSQPLGFYSRPLAGFELPNYPPLAIYSFAFSRLLYHWFSQLTLILNQAIGIFPSRLVFLLPTLNLQAAFVKLPAIFADLGIGFLLFQLLNKRFNDKKSLFYTTLFLFNPAVIYISTVWGQIESLSIFFILLSLYLLKLKTQPKRHYYLSHLSFLFAALSKQTALWLLPLLLVYWLKKQNFTSLLKGLLLQFVGFLLFYLPFVRSPLQALPLYLSTLSGSSNLIADAAWNLWHFVYQGRRIPDSTLLLGIPVRAWSITALLVVYLRVLLVFYRSRKKTAVFYTAFILSLAAFFIQTRVHERHLFPVLPFLLLSPFKKESLRLTAYLAISVFHFLNLYWTLGLPFI